ncbi:MAG TPA: GAF domain-containing protein [Kofleriaceae bacterium]|jgi:phosphotransferase system enzyme I (PtsP)
MPVQVHHRGDRGVDGILRLIELASHDGPLETMLSAMCEQVAAIAGVDVASIYICEDEALVMRGNHGFGTDALGTTLGVGEGITGLVAECMRPISAAHASREPAFKPVPALGEDRFPVFVGVPLIAGGLGSAGVLVMQRAKKPFSDDEVTLATALGAPITLAIERRRASAIRAARLEGRGFGGGVVLGRAGVVPTSTAMTWHASSPNDLDRALARLRDDLSRAVNKLGESDDPIVGTALDRFALVLSDARLRERLLAAAAEPNGLRAVAKEYARAPYRLGTDTDADIVVEIEELCVLVGITADARAQTRPGAIWIADRVGVFVALVAAARGAAALLACTTVSPGAIAIGTAARLPLVAEVAGLFSWARPGDLLAVDGTSGIVLVHPAPSDIERLRRER